MLRDTDGVSTIRTGGKIGDKFPATGFQRLGAQYLATGGETSINTSALTPSLSYLPGRRQVSVRRSSGGGNLISGLGFYETSPTTVGFPVNNPLQAGEIVDIQLEFAVTGIAALAPLLLAYSVNLTVGQTSVSVPNFSWIYNAQIDPDGRIGAAEVKVNGQEIFRGDGYSEVNLNGQNTNQITLLFSPVGGELLTITPKFQYVDSTGPTATFNTQAISTIQDWVSAATQGFTDLSSLISVPATTIQNRAKIIDLASDLGVRMAVNRIMTQQLFPIQGEFGPNGETVYGVANDIFGQIRFVGNWSSDISSSGTFLKNSTVTQTADYVEVTFYGTGLNLLDLPSTAASYGNHLVYVDGVQISDLENNIAHSSALNARKYGVNRVRNVVSGLTLGVHTVKITGDNSAHSACFYGFEILNESSSLAVNPGTSYVGAKKLQLVSSQSLAHNSGFESGTLGTRGGRALVYQKSDGSIGRAVNPAGSSQENLSSADHSNEDIARIYNFREFGCGRSDDFSTNIQSSANIAFTLDDGTTNLQGYGISADVSGLPGIHSNSANAAITFTFVGTGLDIFCKAQITSNTEWQAYIDGISIGNLPLVANRDQILKVVSGLRYGTHTFKIVRNPVSSGQIGLTHFIVYHPKKPSLPSGAIELAEYNILANYVANTTLGSERIAQGVLRKNAIREFTLVGTGWSVGSVDPNTNVTGFELFTNTASDYAEFTFFGTGFEWRGWYQSNFGNMSVSITKGPHAGTTNFSGFTTAYTATNNFAFNAVTGVVTPPNTNAGGYGFSVSGLTLGVHTIRFTRSGSSTIGIEAVDIITPIHSLKTNSLFEFQNTLNVGSQGVSDSRKLTFLKDLPPALKFIGKSVGTTSSPSTSSTVFIPVPDMGMAVKMSKNGNLEINAQIATSSSGSANPFLAIFVDGIQIDSEHSGLNYSGSNSISSITTVVPLAAGYHFVQIMWRSNLGGVINCPGIDRVLTAKEL